MIKNIIFDWSGVISDDFFLVYNAVMKVFDKLKLGRISFEEFRREFIFPVSDFYKKYTNISSEETHPLFLKFIHKSDEPKPYDKVVETVQELKNLGINMIIVSSHPQSKLMIEVENYGLSYCFQEINGSVRNKIEIIEEIMEWNNFNAKETAYIGDMEHDIETGKKVNIKTIASTWGYRPKEKLQEMNPDYIIDNISELKKIID